MTRTKFIICTDERIDVQLYRSPMNVMIYVSKEDHDLITNVKMSDLRFNYQAYRWALRTPTFNHADPYVVRYNRNHLYLRKYLMDLTIRAREGGFR
ncbi:hypothetical protein QE152_g39237 [Popillia japonica]|uniref:Uncharacterized protein n=1 Tax=Popillia japonica TaxID=7064 RepID=A0AAW1HUA8_POPJA